MKVTAIKKTVAVTIFSALLPLTFCSSVLADPGYVQAPSPVSAAKGVIDMHVHPSPDVFERALTDDELAKLAIRKGMRGFVLKNHVAPTADRAYLAMQANPGIEIWGGVALNNSVGGLNPAAVQRMYTMAGNRGKVVWLPTLDADAAVRRIDGKKTGGLRVVVDGKVVPQMDEILKIIAKNDLILGTGHVSADEVVAVVKRAKELGVKNILINHAFTTVPHLSMEQAKAAVKMGAMIEICYMQSLQPQAEWMKHWEVVDAKTTANAIKELGADHIVLSTDLGQHGLMTPPDGVENDVEELRALGVSQADLDKMMKINPAKLLHIDEYAPAANNKTAMQQDKDAYGKSTLVS